MTEPNDDETSDAEASSTYDDAPDAPSAGDAKSATPASAGPTPAADIDWKGEAAKLKDQLLRTAADFDNFRKRSRREVDDAGKRARESAIKDLLPVFDNLERATTSAASAPDVASVVEGLRIVSKQFEATLDRMSIRRIPAVGQTFDPTFHEAIQQVESTEHPAGTVVNEVQAGYALGDHLIRAALVVVSRGPGPSAVDTAN